MSKAKALIDKNLQEYKAKPLTPLALDSLNKLINQTDTVIDSFKPYYQQDPVFCWSLLDFAFEKTKNRPSQPFAADHATSTIGLGGVAEVVKSYKDKPTSPLSNEVNFFLSSSLLASELANIIGETSLGKPQTRWTALMYQMPDTLLWHLHPKSMWRIHYRKLTLPKSLSLFEESKLGFNLFEWRQRVAEVFHLSDDLKRIYQKSLPENLREILNYERDGLTEKSASLKEWHRQEEWLIVLCNRLARALISPWHRSGVIRNKNLLVQLTGLPLTRLSNIVYQAVINTSHHLESSELIVPGVTALMLPSKPYFPDWLLDKSIVRFNVAQRKRQTVPKPETQITPLLKKLTIEANAFNNSAELVQFGLKAIVNELGFCRASFLSINRKAKLVETKLAVAEKDRKKIRPDFSFAQPTPLIKFIDEQSFMLLDKVRHGKIWPKLPTSVQESTDKFVLFSLKPGKQVRALIYIDSKNKTAFNPNKFNMLKLLLKAINKGLAIRNQKAAETKKPAKKAGS